MNKKYAYAFAALMLGLTACSNEDLTAPAENQVAGKTVHVTLTVNRPSDNTRTVVDENPDGRSLYSHWVSGDKLLVVNSGNVNVGELEIESIDSDDASKAVFSGNATLNTTDKYTLVYLGGSNDNRGAYATWTNGTGISNPVATPDSETGFTVSGDLADLCRADLMKKDDVQFLISGENAYPTENVTLGAVNAMAHFTLTSIPGVLDNEAVLTVNYGDVTHKISNITSELYLPMPTGSYILSFSLVNGNDSYTASINDGNSVTVTPLYYVDTDIATGNGKGIPVELAKVVAPEPPYDPANDPDLVGNMFEVNGKKFRFTKGNLKYTVDTGEWSLMDHQYDFICKAGWTTSDGKWQKTKEPVIDLYGYGATGLYDIESDQTANAPTFWKLTSDQTYTLAAYYYPTQETEWNEGYIGSYLEYGIKFTNFDWGKAYYLYKNGEAYPTASKPYTSYDWAIDPSHKTGDPEALRYFTLSSNDWEKLQAKYFMCGVTITGITNPVNTTAKNNIYGCLIFPITGEGANIVEVNKDKLAKVKALLEGHYTYLSTSLTTNLNFTGKNYQYFNYSWLKITKEHFEALEKLGVVFLPEAGHRGPDSYTKTDGYYWTSTNGQANTSTVFRFDGDSSPKVFKLDSQSSRTFGSAVRLVKEVPADYTDPMVVE